MIKITQVRDGGNHVTQSTLTLDAWVERMKEEVKTCPVTMFRSQLRHVLPGDHCEAADKLPKMDACRRVPQDGGRTVHEGL